MGTAVLRAKPGILLHTIIRAESAAVLRAGGVAVIRANGAAVIRARSARRLNQAAEDLVRWMKEIDDRRGDIAELRHETQLGFARVDTRFEKLEGRIDTLEAKMAALMHQGLREQTRFFFLAWSVLLAAIVGLYAR